MKTKKILVIEQMKDISIEEHAYFGYHFDKEKKRLLDTKLYFSKKDDSSKLENVEKVVKFTHVTTLVPSIIFLLLAIICVTTAFILFINKILEFNTSNFLLCFILPLLFFISLGSIFAIKRTIDLNSFVSSPRKNLEEIIKVSKK